MKRTAVDFIHNGVGQGDVAQRLLQTDFDVNVLRPWIGNNGHAYVNRRKRDSQGNFLMNEDGSPQMQVEVFNAPATLRKDEWKQIDDSVMRVAYTQMRLFSDIRSRGLTYSIPNGMGKTVLEFEKLSDVSGAITSMDGIRESDRDRPHYDLSGLPLPIIHKDFQFTARQIATSRNSGTPIDTTMAELSTRKCLEEVEKYTAGSQTFAYAGYNIYGYTNFPPRLTQSITAPTSANHATTITEILSMKKKSIDAGYFGPWMLYFSPAWDAFLDEDYSTTKGENTLRQRLQAIDDIEDVRTSYFLSGNAVVLVQMTSDVVRGVIGMDVVTIQWETRGGMALNYKVMCILVPQLRADFNNKTGIVHGS